MKAHLRFENNRFTCSLNYDFRRKWAETYKYTKLDTNYLFDKWMIKCLRSHRTQCNRDIHKCYWIIRPKDRLIKHFAAIFCHYRRGHTWFGTVTAKGFFHRHFSRLHGTWFVHLIWQEKERMNGKAQGKWLLVLWNLFEASSFEYLTKICNIQEFSYHFEIFDVYSSFSLFFFFEINSRRCLKKKKETK